MFEIYIKLNKFTRVQSPVGPTVSETERGQERNPSALVLKVSSPPPWLQARGVARAGTSLGTVTVSETSAYKWPFK